MVVLRSTYGKLPAVETYGVTCFKARRASREMLCRQYAHESKIFKVPVRWQLEQFLQGFRAFLYKYKAQSKAKCLHQSGNPAGSLKNFGFARLYTYCSSLPTSKAATWWCSASKKRSMLEKLKAKSVWGKWRFVTVELSPSQPKTKQKSRKGNGKSWSVSAAS